MLLINYLMLCEDCEVIRAGILDADVVLLDLPQTPNKMLVMLEHPKMSFCKSQNMC